MKKIVFLAVFIFSTFLCVSCEGIGGLTKITTPATKPDDNTTSVEPTNTITTTEVTTSTTEPITTTNQGVVEYYVFFDMSGNPDDIITKVPAGGKANRPRHPVRDNEGNKTCAIGAVSEIQNSEFKIQIELLNYRNVSISL